ncbi:MAG: hypothetical protein ACLFVU_02460 [Phycisphaerae bacterium]
MRQPRTFRRGAGRGAVLLEVVIALALFFAAAAICTGALHASVRTVSRLDLQAEAADLATTRMTRVQLELQHEGLSDAGPEPFEEPWEDWSWEVSLADIDERPEQTESAPLNRVTVSVRHEPSGYRHSLVRLLPSGGQGTIQRGQRW